MAAVRAHDSDKFNPHGRQSGLSRKSIDIRLVLLLTVTTLLIGMPPSGVPGKGS